MSLKKWRLVTGHEFDLLLHQVIIKLGICNGISILDIRMCPHFHFLRIIVSYSNRMVSNLLTSLVLILWHEICEVLLFLLVLPKYLPLFVASLDGL